jgi:hypothetical protein
MREDDFYLALDIFNQNKRDKQFLDVTSHLVNEIAVGFLSFFSYLLETLQNELFLY